MLLLRLRLYARLVTITCNNRTRELDIPAPSLELLAEGRNFLLKFIPSASSSIQLQKKFNRNARTNLIGMPQNTYTSLRYICILLHFNYNCLKKKTQHPKRS